MNYIRLVWQDIKRGVNLDIYITVIVSVVIAILGVTGIANNAVLFSAVLATLALLSTSLLVNRKDNDGIRDALAQIKPARSKADDFFDLEHELDELIQNIRSARRVYIWGTTFTTHIPLFKDFIKQGLQSGLEIKFLLVKPESSAIKMAAFRGLDLEEETLNSNLRVNLKILDNLSKGTPPGKLEFRVVDYLAPYAVYFFDPHLPSGHMFAHMSTFRVQNNLFRPSFRLTRKEDNLWVEHFLNQFETIWEEANPVNM